MTFAKPLRVKNKELMKSYHSKRCIVCNQVGAEGHHLITRGASGPDEVWNLLPLDRKCHTEVHQIGLTKFASKYDFVKKWLLAHGWNFNDVQNKWSRF